MFIMIFNLKSRVMWQKSSRNEKPSEQELFIWYLDELLLFTRLPHAYERELFIPDIHKRNKDEAREL